MSGILFPGYVFQTQIIRSRVPNTFHGVDPGSPFRPNRIGGYRTPYPKQSRKPISNQNQNRNGFASNPWKQKMMSNWK